MMRGKAIRTIGAATAALTLLLLSAASASAMTTTPVWNLEVHHNQTNFQPGEKAEYWIDLFNVGDVDSSGPVTVTVQLPPGITRDYTRRNTPPLNWECPGAPGDTVITCTTSETIVRHVRISGLAIGVDVAPDASGTPVTTVTAEGGGGATDTELEPTPISNEEAGWGIWPESWFADFVREDGRTPVRQAGEHPELATFEFDVNSVAAPDPALPEVPFKKAPQGNLRHVSIELPPGFVGNPNAVGECKPEQLYSGACPRGSQVGRMDLHTIPPVFHSEASYQAWSVGVFNMEHPRGAITDLAFSVAGQPIHIMATLDAANHYAVKTVVSDINEVTPVFNQKLTLWGVPADQTHNWDRCMYNGTSIINPAPEAPCASSDQRKAFLTVPSNCEESHQVRLFDADSWQHPGLFSPELRFPNPGAKATGCELLRFEPRVALEPTGHAANTPTGLDVHVEVPQNENPNGLATPPIESFNATFPQGMTVSPSFADGLTGCSLDQIGLGSDRAVACPDSSRIGEVRLRTPLLPKELEGSMYISNQKENPFGSTFGLYLVVHDTEERGILVKMPGRLDLDPASGRITTSFDDLPQLPAEDLTLGFRSGPRAPLISPPTCGVKTIEIEVTSWAQPHNPVDASNDYDVTEGPDGTPCPSDLKGRPFAPKMSAGTVDSNAGGFSPFVFRLSRKDSEQELSRIVTTLPSGLMARLVGTSECPDAALASISAAEGTARAEQQNPACPASSQIGTIDVGAGSGTGPNYFAGKTYLAGPYKGARLSIAIVVPALAGPFDLGTVVVRVPIYIDPTTAQVRAVSDPMPTIIHGVLLRVRDVRLRFDRPGTMLNPTSCAPTTVDADIVGAGGDPLDPADDVSVHLANRFQASNCASLAFKPKLGLRLRGGTHRGDYPKLRATLTMPKGNANIARTSVTLPHSAFLAQEHIRTVCTRVQFAAHECPAASVYGHAIAYTPLLDEPLRGPVYLRSSDNPLPDLVASLDGQIHVDLSGRIDSVRGGIRTTFAAVPDAPVTKFVLSMQGGRKGLLVNSTNLCRADQRATTAFKAHNGRKRTARPIVRAGCKPRRG
jgi:uncharacterized repeat protein (TIGR01451 family)